MFYHFLKVLVGFALRIFYKRIYITGKENIKTDKAQLIACNHPAGFLEPLIMACYFPKDLYFLVRGDLFEKKWLRPILTSTHQLPIFRFKDGFSKLRKNSQTVDASTQVLLDKKNLLIFVEGSTDNSKKLRPLKKGIARIAFQALDENPDLDLEILPVGINFTLESRYNEEVMLRVGTPIKVKDYYKKYKEDKIQGYENILADLYTAMKKNVIHIDDDNNLNAFESLVNIPRKDHSCHGALPVTIRTDERLNSEINLANNINRLDSTEHDSIKSHFEKINSGSSNSSHSFSQVSKPKAKIIDILLLIFGFVPAFIGALLHLLPILGGYIFMKLKVKQKEFKSAILFVVTLIFLLLLYIIVVVFILFKVISWVWLPVMIMTGLWARYYHKTIFSVRPPWLSAKIADSEKALRNIYNQVMKQNTA